MGFKKRATIARRKRTARIPRSTQQSSDAAAVDAGGTDGDEFEEAEVVTEVAENAELDVASEVESEAGEEEEFEEEEEEEEEGDGEGQRHDDFRQYTSSQYASLRSMDSEEEDDDEDSFMEPGPASMDEYIGELDDALGAIVRRLGEVIRDVAPDAQEGIKWGMPHYGQAGHVVYIDSKLDHVNLGFFRGAELAEREEARGLFLGAGGKLRHIKLYTVNSIPEVAIRALVTAAIALNRDPSKP